MSELLYSSCCTCARWYSDILQSTCYMYQSLQEKPVPYMALHGLCVSGTMAFPAIPKGAQVQQQVQLYVADILTDDLTKAVDNFGK